MTIVEFANSSEFLAELRKDRRQVDRALSESQSVDERVR